MAIKTSGSLSIQDIVNEFGGTPPHSLDEYYRGGSRVPNVDLNNNVPTSGQISLEDFYGAVNIFFLTISQNTQELNVLDAATNAGWNGQSIIRVVVNSGIYVWSDDVTKGGIIIGDSAYPIQIYNSGYIIGRGGDGGNASAPGQNGGPAITVGNTQLSVVNYSNAYIAGGGGGGGAGQQCGGGGGAGGGRGGRSSEFGGRTNGGLPGQSGQNGATVGNTGGVGGQAGGSGGGTQENKGADSTGQGGGGGRILPGLPVNANIPFGNKEDWPGGYGGGSNKAGGAFGHPYAYTTTQGGNGRSALAAGGGGGWGASGGIGQAAAGAGGRAISWVVQPTIVLNQGEIWGGYL